MVPWLCAITGIADKEKAKIDEAKIFRIFSPPNSARQSGLFYLVIAEPTFRLNSDTTILFYWTKRIKESNAR
jgi:hypothetical protein